MSGAVWRSRRFLSAPFMKQAGSARLFHVFQRPGYPWLWGSVLFDSTGRILEIMALGWLALLLTDSPFWVGMAAGARGLGTMSFGLFSGIMVDRWDRRRIVMASQALSLLAGLALGLLVLLDLIELWQLMVGAFFQGVSLALSMPGRNALTYDLVGRRALLNAMAANFVAFQVTRMVSPTVGGLLIDTVGVAGCYLLIVGAYGTGLLALLRVKAPPRQVQPHGRAWRQLVDLMVHVRHHSSVRSLVLMSVVMEVFAFSHMFMLPVFARDVLDVGGLGLGVLMTAFGVGALAASLFVALLGGTPAKGLLLVTAASGFGLFLILFSLSPWFILSVLLLTLVGACSAVFDTLLGTLLQILVPDELRGRLLGMYAFTFGLGPVGGVQAGAIAGVLGAPVAVGLGGILVLANALRLLPLGRRLRSEAEGKPAP